MKMLFPFCKFVSFQLRKVRIKAKAFFCFLLLLLMTASPVHSELEVSTGVNQVAHTCCAWGATGVPIPELEATRASADGYQLRSQATQSSVILTGAFLPRPFFGISAPRALKRTSYARFTALTSRFGAEYLNVFYPTAQQIVTLLGTMCDAHRCAALEEVGVLFYEKPAFYFETASQERQLSLSETVILAEQGRIIVDGVRNLGFLSTEVGEQFLALIIDLFYSAAFTAAQYGDFSIDSYRLSALELARDLTTQSRREIYAKVARTYEQLGSIIEDRAMFARTGAGAW